MGLDIISSGEPTYWPSDRRKIPYVIDFGVTKNISREIMIPSILLWSSEGYSIHTRRQPNTSSQNTDLSHIVNASEVLESIVRDYKISPPQATTFQLHKHLSHGWENFSLGTALGYQPP
ncbi:hypothetical protein EVAR_69710_1 [Eumeta japonica]|uniref:Uncharacterized protein n=1 Tax=Eumeta variegata TaxID=151549 RepID=A0A4C1SSX0_EUMVA|nr:hypothetical protein EVAR_69710_1 [Eumeta japonica]